MIIHAIFGYDLYLPKANYAKDMPFKGLTDKLNIYLPALSIRKRDDSFILPLD